jgi:hypothetical protein
VRDTTILEGGGEGGGAVGERGEGAAGLVVEGDTVGVDLYRSREEGVRLGSKV